MTIILVASTSTLAARPQSAKNSSSTQSVRERERSAANLVNAALSAPPEFAADFLIKAVTSGITTRASEKIEVLNEAFEIAAHAQNPVRRKDLTGSEVDTRTGYESAAYGLRLDRLSLQSRVVIEMASLDPQRSLSLIERISFPELQPLTCGDGLSYDLSNFYDALRRLGDSANLRAKSRGRIQHLLGSYVRLTSSAQIEPAGRLLLALHSSAEELGDLLRMFTSSLASLPVDVRLAYFTSVATQGTVAGILRSPLGRNGSNAIPVLVAYRNYLVRVLTAPRCSDSFTPGKDRLPESVRFFNSVLLREMPPLPDLQPIVGDEVQPTGTIQSPASRSYWHDSLSAPMLVSIKELRFNGGRQPITLQERDSTEWHDRFAHVLAMVQDCKIPDGYDNMDFYLQKATTLKELAELAPPGQMQTAAVEALVRYVSQNWNDDHRILSFLPISWFLTRVLEASDSQREGLPTITGALTASGHPVLVLYARLNALTVKVR